MSRAVGPADHRLPNKFPKQRAEITELTIRTLEDKTSSARRYAIQLLCKLLETHPFGALHGGTLNLPEWQERYDKISAELAKVDTIEMEKARRDAGMDSDEEGEESDDKSSATPVKADGDADEAESETRAKTGEDGGMEDEDPDSTPRPTKAKKPRISEADLAAVEAEATALDPELVNRLRLTKKYYADALKFINQIESAIPTLCQLLVSTNKSEVLEAMRFFRTAYEYNVASADIGIKTMLHLIWTKDNNSTTSTEDGIDARSVRGNLIDVYRSLYFDIVPDLAPKQQVNRIAKNMIEWVDQIFQLY